MILLGMLVGAVLGAASRLEETAGLLPLVHVSSSTAWLGAAFAAGACAPRALEAAGLGAVTLTFANLGYYGWVAVAEPGRPLAGVAGPIDRWFELGVGGGLVFGALGCAARRADSRVRALAGLVLAGVFAFEIAGIRTHALGPGIP